jgi:hypothetical protein
LNPGHRGGKPATNRLSYGAAYLTIARQRVGKYIPEATLSTTEGDPLLVTNRKTRILDKT